MPEKPYKYMEGADSEIRDKVLEVYGHAPNNFIESAEGGAVEGELLAKETAEDERVISEGLLRQLGKVNPEIVRDGHLRQ